MKTREISSRRKWQYLYSCFWSYWPEGFDPPFLTYLFLRFYSSPSIIIHKALSLFPSSPPLLSLSLLSKVTIIIIIIIITIIVKFCWCFCIIIHQTLPSATAVPTKSIQKWRVYGILIGILRHHGWSTRGIFEL